MALGAVQSAKSPMGRETLIFNVDHARKEKTMIKVSELKEWLIDVNDSDFIGIEGSALRLHGKEALVEVGKVDELEHSQRALARRSQQIAGKERREEMKNLTDDEMRAINAILNSPMTPEIFYKALRGLHPRKQVIFVKAVTMHNPKKNPFLKGKDFAEWSIKHQRILTWYEKKGGKK